MAEVAAPAAWRTPRVPATSPLPSLGTRQLAEQAPSRSAGAPLPRDNAAGLLIDRMGAALVDQRELGRSGAGPLALGAAVLLLLAATAWWRPAILAWPSGSPCVWLALNLAMRAWHDRRCRAG